jgi:hypothetical protein
MCPPYVLFPNRDKISYELDFFQNNSPLYWVGTLPGFGSNSNNMFLCMVHISGKQNFLKNVLFQNSLNILHSGSFSFQFANIASFSFWP